MARKQIDWQRRFLDQARAVHGKRYDYSNATYVKAAEKVEIVCKKHGSFLQAPSDHVKGRGCPNCGWERMDTKKFIEKSKKVHGDTYDYSKSRFVTSQTKTTVICKMHGEFRVSPNSHQRGTGCPLCGNARTGEKKKEAAKESFIKKAKKIHGKKIDYSKANYTTAKEKTIFVCHKHGDFSARPDNILHGKGCPECRREKIMAANRKKSQEAAKKFVARAMRKHGKAYDYSQAKYETIHKPISIICPLHGQFEQSPANHLAGNGCPDCTLFGYRSSKPGWVYLHAVGDRYLKFGITNHDPRRRLKEIVRGSKYEHKLINKWYFKEGHQPLMLEAKVRDSIETGVVSSEEMASGFTETTERANLRKIRSIVKKFAKEHGGKEIKI